MSDHDPYAPHTVEPDGDSEFLEPVEAETDEVPQGTIAEVKRWVGEDSDRARRALEVEENSDNPRTTLVSHLKEQLSTDDN